MNNEQKLRLPCTREDLLVVPFIVKKLVYAVGLGVFAYERCKGKLLPPPPGKNEPLQLEDYDGVSFIYLPEESYFNDKLAISRQLEVVKIDVTEMMKSYEPNTGVTTVYDCNGLVTLQLNFRKEADGAEKVMLLGVNEKFAKEKMEALTGYCTISKTSDTGLVTIKAL